MPTEELDYAIALSHTWLSGAVLHKLVRALEGVYAVWQASESQLAHYLDESQVNKLLAARRSLDPKQLGDAYRRLGIQVFSLNDPGYPELLKNIHDPPFLLYVRGNPLVLHQRSLAVVGTRRFTEYGQRVVETLVEQLVSYQPCIVSGLAAGIDTWAHRLALAHQLPTVAVFGTGIDQVYPQANMALAQQILDSGGALLSEYPMGMPGSRYAFPRRNRIIAGITQGTLVVEGSLKSGALITARQALDENRQVMAVPGSIFSPGCQGPNQLIRDGAYPVQHGEEIAHVMGWQTQPKQGNLFEQQQDASVLSTGIPESLSKKEAEILMTVGYDATSFEEIQTRNKALTIMELQSALTMLELYGLITPLPGARFCRN